MRSFLLHKPVFILLLFSGSFAYAQVEVQPELWLCAGGHYGFLIPHSENLIYLVSGHTPGGEVSLSKTTTGEKKWQRDYHYPEIGVNAYYTSLSNSSKLGYGISISPFVNFPWIQRKNFSLKFKAAVSAGYISKTFDRVNNFQNGAIGSRFNGFVNLRLNAHSMISPNYRIEYGLGLSHFSNGAFKMPNLGVNVVTLNLGLAYKISTCRAVPHSIDTSLAQEPAPKFAVVFWAGGFKSQVVPPSGINYPAFTVSSSFDWLVSVKSRFLIGLEVSYNGGNRERLSRDSIFIDKKSELLQEGIKAGYAVRVGQLELPFEFGYYLHALYKGEGVYFHRIGLRYYCSNRIILNFTLKTHWAVANYWECGIGYSFLKKTKK